MSETHVERWFYTVALYIEVPDDETDADKQADDVGDAIISAVERAAIPGVYDGSIAEDDFRSEREDAA